MGATSSVQTNSISSLDGTDLKLTEEDLAIFTEFEKECCTKKISFEELQRELYNKYLELIEKEKNVLQKQLDDAAAEAAESHIKLPPKTPSIPPTDSNTPHKRQKVLPRFARPLKRQNAAVLTPSRGSSWGLPTNSKNRIVARQQAFQATKNSLVSNRRPRSLSPEKPPSLTSRFGSRRSLSPQRRQSINGAKSVSALPTLGSSLDAPSMNIGKTESNSSIVTVTEKHMMWDDNGGSAIAASHLETGSVDTADSHEEYRSSLQYMSTTDDEQEEFEQRNSDSAGFDLTSLSITEQELAKQANQQQTEISRRGSKLSLMDPKELESGSVDKLQEDIQIPSRPPHMMTPETYECKLCKKKFDSKSLLEIHLSHSQIHRQALLELRRRYAVANAGLSRLESLARRVIERFQEALQYKKALSSSREDISVAEASATSDSVSKRRWKRAVHKVIRQRENQKAVERLEELEQSLYSAKHLLDLRNEDSVNLKYQPKLLYEGSKFFWRTKTRFMIYFFVHEMFHCLEIVPLNLANQEELRKKQLRLDFTQLRAEEDTPHPVKHSTAEDDHHGTTARHGHGKPSARGHRRSHTNKKHKKQNAVASSETDEDEEDTETNIPRIYLDLRVISDTIRVEFQQHIKSGLGNVINAEEDGSHGNYLSPIALFGDSYRMNSDHDQLAKLTILHLTSRLKLDYDAIKTGFKTAEQALYYDDSSYSNAASPLLTSVPRRLFPAKIDNIKSYQKQEIQVKVEEMIQSKKDLATAVEIAEKLSKTVQISPKRR